jgi:hypothetical protein
VFLKRESWCILSLTRLRALTLQNICIIMWTVRRALVRLVLIAAVFALWRLFGDAPRAAQKKGDLRWHCIKEKGGCSVERLKELREMFKDEA